MTCPEWEHLHVYEVMKCVPLKDAGSNVCQHLEAEMEASVQIVAGQKWDPSSGQTVWQCLGVGIVFALLWPLVHSYVLETIPRTKDCCIV